MTEAQAVLKPDEVLSISNHDERERIIRIIHMLKGNKAKAIGKGFNVEVRLLDGKAYLVAQDRLEIWDYFFFRSAQREGIVTGIS